jgi:hypothetical protein
VNDEPDDDDQLIPEMFDPSVKQPPDALVDVYLQSPDSDDDIARAIAPQLDPNDPGHEQRAQLLAAILTPDEEGKSLSTEAEGGKPEEQTDATLLYGQAEYGGGASSGATDVARDPPAGRKATTIQRRDRKSNRKYQVGKRGKKGKKGKRKK